MCENWRRRRYEFSQSMANCILHTHMYVVRMTMSFSEAQTSCAFSSAHTLDANVRNVTDNELKCLLARFHDYEQVGLINVWNFALKFQTVAQKMANTGYFFCRTLYNSILFYLIQNDKLSDYMSVSIRSHGRSELILTCEYIRLTQYDIAAAACQSPSDGGASKCALRQCLPDSSCSTTSRLRRIPENIWLDPDVSLCISKTARHVLYRVSSHATRRETRWRHDANCIHSNYRLRMHLSFNCQTFKRN